jgi:hypothetical protein
MERLEIHVSKGEGQDLPHELGNKVPVRAVPLAGLGTKAA